MRWILPVVLSVTSLAPVVAWSQTTPIDVGALPAEIKELKWREIDLAKASPLERCRALSLLNATLDELRAQMVADADLMSAYIDAKGLGGKYVQQAALPDPGEMEQGSGQKIAMALLRGPMSGSTYAKEFADASPAELASFQQLNESSCRAKWAQMSGVRADVRGMVHFLRMQEKMDDYNAWVPVEIQRRTPEHDAAVKASTPPDADEMARQRRLAQIAQVEQRQLDVERMQTAMTLGENQMYHDNYINTSARADGGQMPRWYYGGVRGGGEVYGWYRDPAYRETALAASYQRMGRWHGLRR